MSNSHPTEPSPPDSRAFVFEQVKGGEEKAEAKSKHVAVPEHHVESTLSSSSSSDLKFLTQAADKTVAGSGTAVITLPDQLAGQDEHDKTGQSIFLPNDDLLLSLRFYHRSTSSRITWYACCILSVSILYIIAYWYPRVWLRWNGKLTTLEESKTRKGGQIWIAVKVCRFV